jgi:4-amino-4-deoxy-L-arabinose transferase-like glycosyltransferase
VALVTNAWIWSKFFLLVALSTASGYGLARAFPWANADLRHRLCLPLGLCLAPFLLGIATAAALAFLDAHTDTARLWFVVAVLSAIGLLALWRAPTFSSPSQSPFRRPTLEWWLLSLVLLVCVIDLGFLAQALPLVENDALEYGMVGRAIYETGALRVYPLNDPEIAASGFFAPWTHPPLYTTLIYLTYVIQESAAHAMVLKAIAPWFLLTAAYGVWGLARLHGAMSAHVAATLFLSTPLLAVGAQSAAIDPLPVAGMVLMMIGLTAVDANQQRGAVFVGLLTGLAMWTHSQAILYIPILVCLVILMGGFQRWRASLKFSATAVLVVVLVAGYPYARNLSIYGSLISDNPAVFALHSLDWNGFFKYARSIYTTATRIQYGTLKGIVAVHSFGGIFWFFTVAILGLGAVGILGRWIRLMVKDSARIETSAQPLVLSLCLVGIYFAGIVASIAIGTDLMIKNDRYLLVMAPAACVAAACGLAELRDRLDNQWIASGVFLATVALILGHSATFLLYANYLQWIKLLSIEPAQWIRKADKDSSAFEPPKVSFLPDPLTGWPNLTIAKELDKEVPEGSKVLAIRPADMYYAERKMISYLDPRMVAIYKEPDPYRFAKGLQQLGVTHIQIPDYFIPPVANSALMKVIADPSLTLLVKDYSFQQLYRLKDPEASHSTVGRVRDLSRLHWNEYPRIGIGGPTFALRPYTKEVGQLPYVGMSTSSLLARSYSHMVELAPDPISVTAGKEYLLRLSTEGEGFMRIWIWWLAPDAPDIARRPEDKGHLAGDFILSPQVNHLTFERRMRVPQNVTHVRIGIERYGISRLTFDKAELVEILGNSEPRTQ